MKISPILPGLSLLLLFDALVHPALAYQYESSYWPDGSNVVIQLGFGPTAISLQDGMASWNASAADALDIWDGYLDKISVSSVSSAAVP